MKLGVGHDVLQRFNDWMNSREAAYVVVAWLVGGWMLVLVHELAHAAMALRLGARKVSVSVGREPGWSPRTVGPVSLSLSPVPSRPAGTMTTPDPLPPARRLMVVLAGPAGNVMAATLLLALFLASSGAVRISSGILCAVSLAMAIASLVRRVHRGSKNDGARAIEMLRLWRTEHGLIDAGPEGTRAVEAYRRYLSLPREARLNHTRIRELSVVVNAFGVQPTTPAGTHLCAVAFAGWCWAEANGDDNLGAWSWGDPAGVLQQVAALATADRRHHVNAAAAMKLTADANNLSPDNGPIGQAISRTIPAKHGVAETERQTAIRYGMAIHLVETHPRELASVGPSPT